MTRINIVPVNELSNEHLFAEWREMPRLVGNLHKSLNRKGKPFSMSEIPDKYKLGTGHVKFFYDKFKFLHQRHKEITKRLLELNYNLSFVDSEIFTKVPTQYYNDYKPSADEILLNKKRIEENIKKSIDKKKQNKVK